MDWQRQNGRPWRAALNSLSIKLLRRSFHSNPLGRNLECARALHRPIRVVIEVIARTGALHPNLDDVPEVASRTRDREIVAIDEALDALTQVDPRKAKVIELRFFGGLSVEETAEVLKISPQTVMRDWKMARAWLMAEITG
jgi:RNA polymerase sigma factor (sigma-70 family)